MKALGVRGMAVAIIMVVALGILIGGQLLYNRTSLDKPLHDAIAAVPGVESVSADTDRDPMRIEVSLKQVPNLAATYQALDRAADGVLKDRPYEIRVKDTRTAALTADYYDLNAILEEGLATGLFTEMTSRIHEKAQALGLDSANVYLDDDHMYVQLVLGAHYLYEVVPRHPKTLKEATP